MPKDRLLSTLDARDLIELAASAGSALSDRLEETRRELNSLEGILREIASRFGLPPSELEALTVPAGAEDGTPERGA